MWLMYTTCFQCFLPKDSLKLRKASVSSFLLLLSRVRIHSWPPLSTYFMYFTIYKGVLTLTSFSTAASAFLDLQGKSWFLRMESFLEGQEEVWVTAEVFSIPLGKFTYNSSAWVFSWGGMTHTSNPDRKPTIDQNMDVSHQSPPWWTNKLYLGYLEEYGGQVTYRRRNGSLKAYPIVSDSPRKLEPWSTLHDLLPVELDGRSPKGKSTAHSLLHSHLFTALLTLGRASHKSFGCQRSQTCEVCLLSDSFEPPQSFPKGNVLIQRKLFHIKKFL